MRPSKGPRPPGMPGPPVFRRWMVLAALVLVACTPAKSPTARHMARGAILAVAQAVKVADHECATLAKAKYDGGDLDGAIALAEKCEKGYEAARHGLVAAAYAVDAWGSSHDGDVACAMVEGVEGLKAIVAAVQSAGGVLPADVADGIDAADWVVKAAGGAACKVKP